MFVIHFYLIFHKSENRHDTQMIVFKNCAIMFQKQKRHDKRLDYTQRFYLLPLQLMKIKVGKGFNEKKPIGPIYTDEVQDGRNIVAMK